MMGGSWRDLWPGAGRTIVRGADRKIKDGITRAPAIPCLHIFCGGAPAIMGRAPILGSRQTNQEFAGALLTRKVTQRHGNFE